LLGTVREGRDQQLTIGRHVDALGQLRWGSNNKRASFALDEPFAREAAQNK
jgi:hypothetical protein